MSNTVNDLFNPTGAVVTTPRNTDLYKVSYKDGKNGVYNSVVRFIPFYLNPSKNIMQKYTSWVKNPLTQKGMYVDDPRAVGQPSPVVELFFELKKTGIQTYIDYGKNYLSSKLNYSSLVQIIKDDQHPELEGQIKVFVFGKTIWEKLHYEEFPQIPGQTGVNPFDPFRGRYFAISCSKNGDFNNFDNSQFFDNKDAAGNILPSGIWYLNPDTGKMDVARDGMNRQHLVDYLSANSPDLSKYDFQPWNEEQTKHVNETCSIIRNYMATGQLQNPAAGTAQAAMGVLAGAPQSATIFPGATTQPSPVPVTPAAPSVPAAPIVPQPSAGGFVPTQPSAPAPNVRTTTVTAPIVTPSAPAPASQPQNTAAAGINMDDILNQL